MAYCDAIHLYAPVFYAHAAPAVGLICETVTEGRGDSNRSVAGGSGDAAAQADADRQARYSFIAPFGKRDLGESYQIAIKPTPPALADARGRRSAHRCWLILPDRNDREGVIRFELDQRQRAQRDPPHARRAAVPTMS